MKIFITGASDGIGREAIKQLARRGDAIWGIARRTEPLSELQKEFGKDKFYFSVGDVGDEKVAADVYLKMKEEKFSPDVVILNAAVFLEDAEPQYNHDLFMQAHKTNVLGAMVWVDKFLPDFLKRGFGKFVAISSVSAFRPNLKSISLSSTKVALAMAFRGLRLRYIKNNISFSNIYFGPVATKMIPGWTLSSEKKRPRYPFVLSKEKAAKNIIEIIDRKSGDYWFPFWTTLFFRLSFFIPDRIFSLITQYLKK